MNDAILVFTSVGSEQQAITIAEELVQQGLAACVNILPTMRSIYRFNGKVFDDEENFLVIKTTQDLFESVSVVISQMHTYEVPEIMGVKIDQCQGDFLSWIHQNLNQANPIETEPEVQSKK